MLNVNAVSDNDLYNFTGRHGYKYKGFIRQSNEGNAIILTIQISILLKNICHNIFRDMNG